MCVSSVASNIKYVEFVQKMFVTFSLHSTSLTNIIGDIRKSVHYDFFEMAMYPGAENYETRFNCILY